MDLVDRAGMFFINNFNKLYLVAGCAIASFGVGKFIYDTISNTNRNDGLAEVIVGV